MWCSSSFLSLASVLASLSGGVGATPSAHLRSSRAEAGAGQCWCSQDTDYAGGDLGWVKVGSAAECCSSCGAYPGCTVSVFFGNRCYLKNSSVPVPAPSHHVACRPHASRPDHLEDSRKNKVVKSASCRTYGCGGRFSPSQTCQCNHGCKAHGNCCYDYTEQCSSSAGKGKGNKNISNLVKSVSCAAYGCAYYRSGSPCQCTPKCREYNNCCHDYKATCLAGGGGNYHDDDNDDAGRGSAHHDDDTSNAGETSTAQSTSKTDATTAASTTAAVTAATTEAAVTAATTVALTTHDETTGKVTATTEAVEAATSTSVGTSAAAPTDDTTASNSVPSPSQTGTDDATNATYDSTTLAKHATAEATTSSSDGSSSSSSSGDRSNASMSQQRPKHSADATTQMALDASDLQTTTLSTTLDSITVANAKNSSDSEEREISDDSKQHQSTSSSSSSNGGLSISLAADLADALNRNIVAKGDAAHQKSSSDEKGKKDGHGASNKVLVLKKFLQTAPHWKTGHKTFHNAPAWIVLLAGGAIFATFAVRARMQLCRRREQDAEEEQLLQPTSNIPE